MRLGRSWGRYWQRGGSHMPPPPPTHGVKSIHPSGLLLGTRGLLGSTCFLRPHCCDSDEMHIPDEDNYPRPFSSLPLCLLARDDLSLIGHRPINAHALIYNFVLLHIGHLYSYNIFIFYCLRWRKLQKTA